MKNECLLLAADLLRTKEFKEYKYWKNALAAEPGWHYALDIIWIIKKIKSLKLPKSATILDAGAGYGLMQFILAGMGYNVISVDYSPRKIPFPYIFMFNLKNSSTPSSTTGKYIKHLNKISGDQKNILIKLLLIVKRVSSWNFISFITQTLKKTSHGNIQFLKADFSNLKMIKSHTVDAIVSVSAIEHCPSFHHIQKSVKEFERVLKDNSPMIITTSAAKHKTWFHKNSQGWCFSKEDLSKLFSLQKSGKEYQNYKEIFYNINGSVYLQKSLPSYYFYTERCGMPKGIWNVTYLPVGIFKRTGKQNGKGTGLRG